MKQIIFKQEDVININSITNNSIIAIEWPNDPNKTWVAETDEGDYQGLHIGCDNTSKWKRNSVKEYCESANKQQKSVKIYSFDSRQDLMEWLKK